MSIPRSASTGLPAVRPVRKPMTEDEIHAHAEARANLTGDSFETALRDIRDMIADGYSYSSRYGWTI